MASIIPGYEYDIFISYRQKDNKYDGWVTEFIDYLKRELEATFKEDVSIYFDENPHDGLLEIHNVDKSLENKLKSLIFIPIISQTYCDPKSFAWQKEFAAFNKMSSADQLGRDIKLPSGNVCSRIIPVKIHDLDASDTELIEKEMGCRLRAIEFIYTSAGVSRPLKPDDNPDKNLNRTYYRDQINKVAHAIKDLIYGVHPDPEKRASKTYQTRETAYYSEDLSRTLPGRPSSDKRISRTALLLIALGILVVVASVIFIPRMIQKAKTEVSAVSIIKTAIAVLPVADLTGNPNLEYIAKSIHDDLIGRLQAISRLIVRPGQSTLQFKNSEESIQQIAKKLNVNKIVESTLKGSKDNLQVEVRLIEAFPEEKHIWSTTFNHNWNNINENYRDIISHILEGTQIKLNSQESKKLAITQKHDTALLNAYNLGTYYVSRLTREDFEKGIKYFNEAMTIDPTDPLPYLGLALGYSNSSHAAGVSPDAADRAKKYAEQALELDSTLADAHVVLASRALYTDWDFNEAEYHLKLAMEMNPSSVAAHCHYGWFLSLNNRVDEAANEMKKAIEIDPTDPWSQGYLSWLYLWFGRPEESLTEARKTIQLRNNYPMGVYVMGSAFAELGMYKEAIETHLNRLNPNSKGVNYRSPFISGLGVAYARAGLKEDALKVAAEMEKQNNYWNTWGLADIYAALGDKDKAIYWIEEAYKARQDFVPWFKYYTYYKPLQDDPRFKEIISRLNLPEE